MAKRMTEVQSAAVPLTTFEDGEAAVSITAHPGDAPIADHGDDITAVEQATLPPTDGGKDAILLLVGCFMVEAMCWALPFSYGVFQDYYTRTPPFSHHPNGIAAIGTCVLSILYLGGSVVYALLNRFVHAQKYTCVVGIGTMSLSLVLASFAQTVWQLLLTQGIMFGVGGCLLLYTSIHFLDEWFVRRKGFAFGVLCTGNGVAGATVPFLLNWSLTTYSFRTTLRIWALIIPILTLPFLPFLRPRIPIPPSAQPKRVSYTFLLTWTFWLYQSANILQGLGYFMPTIYLSVYAQHLGYSKTVGSLLIALINVAAVASQLCLGWLVDTRPVADVMMISAVGSAVAVLVLWGTATTLEVLIIFALAYGLFAGGWTSTFIGMTKEMMRALFGNGTGQEGALERGRGSEAAVSQVGADSATVFGLFVMGRGVGAVVSGPLSEALLGETGGFPKSSLGYGTGYGAVIVFTGVSALCGASSFVAKRVLETCRCH